mgnify:FL=1
MDPWGLAVSPENFASQMRALRKSRDVLRLGEFGRRWRDGSLSPRSVAITFDDGYACNALVAAPILASHQLPGTFFLTTGMIGSDREFWNDELERVVFDPASGGCAEIQIGGTSVRVDLGKETDLPETRRMWREIEPSRTIPQAVARRIGMNAGAYKPARTARQSAYLSLWRELKPLAPDEQWRAIDAVAAQVGSTAPPRASHRAMTREEARRMAALDIVEIGGHTVNHVSLPYWDRERQRREISDSLDACEDISGRPASSFAYPYGDHSEVTLEVAADRSIQAACSTRALPVRRSANPLALPRMQVLDWSGKELDRILGSFSTKH